MPLAEALFDMRIWGKKGRLTRRNPFRINLEIGLGGSLHSENNDSYSEQTYVSAADNDMQSNSLGGRLKLEYERRNPYSRNNIRAFWSLSKIFSKPLQAPASLIRSRALHNQHR